MFGKKAVGSGISKGKFMLRSTDGLKDVVMETVGTVVRDIVKDAVEWKQLQDRWEMLRMVLG